MIFSNLFLKPEIEIISMHQTPPSLFPSEYLLFFLYNGKAKLKMKRYNSKLDSRDAKPFLNGICSLCIDDAPLIQIYSECACPTCESLLAAGYGTPSDNTALRQAADRMNALYNGIEDAIGRIEPLISMLPSGAWILTASDYYPTDGNGHFFWNVPNDFTSFAATAQIYDCVNFRSFPCAPFYLYPSQPTSKFDEDRVDHYRAHLRAGRQLPPALAYSISGYISILLDGHHRACACALEGKRLPCLTISPVRHTLPKDHTAIDIFWPSDEKIAMAPLTRRQINLLTKSYPPIEVINTRPPETSHIFSYNWPREYHEAAEKFPTYKETGALSIYPFEKLTVEGIRRLLVETKESNETETAILLFSFLYRQNDMEKKRLAFSFTAPSFESALRLEAFQKLHSMKDDPEIEDFFVDFLVNCDDKSNPLRKIADSYWDL